SCFAVFSVMLPLPPRRSLVPYTTLFRSPVSVFVGDEVLESWQQGHGRQLGSTERYAVAKMSLFQAFDQRAAPEAMSEEVRVQARSEEHTSELQSRSDCVCRLRLEKKNYT